MTFLRERVSDLHRKQEFWFTTCPDNLSCERVGTNPTAWLTFGWEQRVTFPALLLFLWSEQLVLVLSRTFVVESKTKSNKQREECWFVIAATNTTITDIPERSESQTSVSCYQNVSTSKLILISLNLHSFLPGLKFILFSSLSLKTLAFWVRA